MYYSNYANQYEVAHQIQRKSRRTVLLFDDIFQALPICGFDVGI